MDKLNKKEVTELKLAELKSVLLMIGNIFKPEKV